MCAAKRSTWSVRRISRNLLRNKVDTFWEVKWALLELSISNRIRFTAVCEVENKKPISIITTSWRAWVPESLSFLCINRFLEAIRRVCSRWNIAGWNFSAYSTEKCKNPENDFFDPNTAAVPICAIFENNIIDQVVRFAEHTHIHSKIGRWNKTNQDQNPLKDREHWWSFK